MIGCVGSSLRDSARQGINQVLHLELNWGYWPVGVFCVEAARPAAFGFVSSSLGWLARPVGH